MKTIRQALIALLLAAAPMAASARPQAPPSNPDTTSLAPDGTARITREIPVPMTVSPEAQAFLRTGASWAPAAGSEEQRLLIEKARALYPVWIEDAVIGGVPGLDGARPPERGHSPGARYLGDRDPKDPLVSPIYSDLAGWPPTLCVSGTRDLLLSGTVNFHRALLKEG